MITGRRTITSNLDVSRLSAKVGEPRKGCKTLPGTINPAQSVKLTASAAVLTSARFPYVTPGGLLPLAEYNADPKKPAVQCWDLIVDGGYVDNEGTLSARELLKRLVEAEPHAQGEDPVAVFAKNYLVIVLRLSNQPSPRAESEDDANKVSTPSDRDSPLQLVTTFLKQQNASGRDQVNDFNEYVSTLGGCFIEFNALHDDAPLGWSLSEKSRNRLDAWLDGPASETWKTLYKNAGTQIDSLAKLANEVKMIDRLKRVQNLLNGTAATACDLKDPESAEPVKNRE